MGQLLVQVKPRPGMRTDLLRDISVPRLTQEYVAESAGIKERQRKTSIRIAKIPEADFEQMVESEKAPTVSDLIRETKRKEVADKY